MNATATGARTAALLAGTLRLPVVTRAVDRLAGEPRVADERVAGLPALVARPSGRGAWPAVVFGNAAHRLGAEEPYVRQALRSLARAGFLVVVPDLPGLRVGEITPATVDATVEVARATSERSDVRHGRVALAGASTGAGLALLAAADPRLDGRLSIVAGIAPFADLENVLRLATTGFYAEAGRLVPYPVAPLLAHAVPRSLVAALPPGADAASITALLANRDPERFDELYASLPAEVRAVVTRLSPLACVDRVRVPVELASAPADRYFPIAESRALAAANPAVRLTVTSTLEHARARLTAGGTRDLLRFAGFVARVIAAITAGQANAPSAERASTVLSAA